MSDRVLTRRALFGAMGRAGTAGGLAAGMVAAPGTACAGGHGLGLIFVAAASCPYCQAIAPVLADLERSGRMPVLVASTDGRPVAPFTAFEHAAAHPMTAHLREVPHVLVWHRGLDTVTHEVRGFRDMRHFVLHLSAALRQASAL